MIEQIKKAQELRDAAYSVYLEKGTEQNQVIYSQYKFDYDLLCENLLNNPQDVMVVKFPKQLLVIGILEQLQRIVICKTDRTHITLAGANHNDLFFSIWFAKTKNPRQDAAFTEAINEAIGKDNLKNLDLG
jgi:hypothetical protein